MKRQSAKDEIISRVRNALVDVPPGELDSEIPRDYRTKASQSPRSSWRELFTARVREYRAKVTVTDEESLPSVIDSLCRREGVKRIVIAPGFPESWHPPARPEMTVVPELEQPLSHHDLDQCDAVLTSSALAVASTGTIILDGGAGQGRRALSLIPDFHICIVREDQITGDIPAAFDRLNPPTASDPRPITFISGPSATSDIELTRVEGVHGPRNLHVLLVTDSPK